MFAVVFRTALNFESFWMHARTSRRAQPTSGQLLDSLRMVSCMVQLYVCGYVAGCGEMENLLDISCS
jgi:hypothetical protein